VTKRLWQSAVVLGLIVTVLLWFDALFIPLALIGPLVIGAVAGYRGLPVVWPATVSIVAGLGALVSDWVINQEDVAFHAVLTLLMLALSVVAWQFVVRRRRPAAGTR